QVGQHLPRRAQGAEVLRLIARELTDVQDAIRQGCHGMIIGPRCTGNVPGI
ncbi:MAG: hypothetical protein QOG16_1620, partial [Actinomycetota bacterium]|nr:hypothetical protein [Actinomycetota bacterium]